MQVLQSQQIHAPLLSQYVAIYLDRLTRMRSPSLASYASAWRQILGTIEDRPINGYDPQAIVGWVIAARQRWAPRTVRTRHSMLRALFQSAWAEGITTYNPAAKLPPGILPRDVSVRPQRAILDLDALRRLIASPSIPISRRSMWAAYALTGARAQELAACQWRHMLTAFPLSALRIEQTAHTKSRSIRPTKTAIARDVPIHPALSELLWAWRERWASSWGHEPTPEDWIWPCRWRRELRPQQQPQILERWKQDLCRLSLPETTIHALRATFVSLAREHGAEPDALWHLTHPGTESRVRRAYLRWTWPTLCRVVQAIPLEPHTEPEQLTLL